MADTYLHLGVSGHQEMVSTIKGVDSRTKNMRPALAKSASVVISSIKKNFSTAGSLLGKPWDGRTRSYPWPTLDKIGKMKQGFIAAVDDKKAVISNPVSYYPYHQSSAPRRKIPRREMLGYTGNDVIEITRFIGQYAINGKV